MLNARQSRVDWHEPDSIRLCIEFIWATIIRNSPCLAFCSVLVLIVLITSHLLCLIIYFHLFTKFILWLLEELRLFVVYLILLRSFDFIHQCYKTRTVHFILWSHLHKICRVISTGRLRKLSYKEQNQSSSLSLSNTHTQVTFRVLTISHDVMNEQT